VPKIPKPSPAAPFDGHYDIIALGASAGGLDALSHILADLTVASPPIVIVQHLSPTRESHLASILANRSHRTVKQAEHRELILPGYVYVGPPDEHLLVGPGTIQLVHSQLVHFSRPSIDLLFESVAGLYGSRSIAVILSGSNKDGAFGIEAVRQAGGVTIAQNPADAEYPTMPQAAIETGCVDYIVDVDKIGGLLVKLCSGVKVRQ
jgi:two-component system chemotaxis response regulator CheB